MLGDSEQILFVTQAEVIAYVKQDARKEVKNSIFVLKKIIVTTERILIFEALDNRLQETEYELTSTVGKKQNKHMAGSQARISVNGFPETWMDHEGLESKVIIQEDPVAFKYLQKQGIRNIVKSTVGLVLLKDQRKRHFHVLAMGGMQNAIRFAKALICGQSWAKYERLCPQLRVRVNPMWVRVLTEVISNEESVVLIDPDLFLTGSKQELQSFVFLLTAIPFAHCFHHRYSITTPEAAEYAAGFISPIQAKIHSLSFSHAHMTVESFKLVIKSPLSSLMKLDLSHNFLTDETIDVIHRTIKNGAKKLSYLNLSHNKIKLGNAQILTELFKAARTILNLNLSHNLIDDHSIESFEKYIICAYNPPVEEINLSHNKFSRKGAWRLYVGNAKYFRVHPYLTFILYPIPVKKEIFGGFDLDFPRHNATINLNMHSALIEEFEQESLLKHTFEDMPAGAREALTISFQRVLAADVKLPINRQELNQTLQISHKIENFIYAPQPVEKIYETAMELKKFPFEVPPITRQHFIKYLYQKFNQALFIRDHYSVKYLYNALKELGGAVEGYRERLEVLSRRDTSYSKRSEAVLNCEVDENRINFQLDQLVRQGLRLYLQGQGVEILYYLKYKRDQKIEKYLSEKVNPQNYLFNLMAKKNINAEQRVSEKEFIIPYEIRLEKKINQNFYLHPWQTNYQILCQMTGAIFESCLQFLEQSQKKEKFAPYFDRIEQRIQFIKNEFGYFSYNKFKASYSDLKINSCRLLYLYNNIKDTSIYLEIPIYVKKRLITQEKPVVVMNPKWFNRQYHIVHYPNINAKAKKANYYNYQELICRYNSEIFHNQAKKILPHIRSIKREVDISATTRAKMNMEAIVFALRNLIDVVRRSLVPEELKEEIYLHMIGWQRGRHGGNREMVQLLPVFTMYLKPPLQIEKYLLASILQNDQIDLQDYPLCLSTNPNQPTTEQALTHVHDFVERDWLPTDRHFSELLTGRGQVTLDLQLLEHAKISIKVAESKSVGELMEMVTECVQMNTSDKEHFWLFRVNKETQEIVSFESRQHVGQILAQTDLKENILLLKRRIYSRQLRFNYANYGENMLNSLYHDHKFEYLFRNFFISDERACDLAATIFIIQCVETSLRRLRHSRAAADEVTIEKIIEEEKAMLDATCLSYVPKRIFDRLMKSKEEFVNQMRDKIKEKVLKKQHNAIHEMKIGVLKSFSAFPEFMSTNHRVSSNLKQEMRVSINSMFIFIENETESEYIGIEKIVTILPKSKYLLLYYHKQENLVAQLPMFAQEKTIFALIGDILTYCSLRLKMSSINLYEIYHHENYEKKIIELETTLKRTYQKQLEKELNTIREERVRSGRKISKMTPTLLHFKEIIYFNRNKYIKSEVNRKLYANKSEKQLEFEQADEEELNETAQATRKILSVIFPDHAHLHDVSEEPYYQEGTPVNDSFDWRKDYEKLNIATEPKMRPVNSEIVNPTSSRPPSNPSTLYPPQQPSLAPSRNTIVPESNSPTFQPVNSQMMRSPQERQPYTPPKEETLTPTAKKEDDDGVVTAPRRRNPPSRRRNR